VSGGQAGLDAFGDALRTAASVRTGGQPILECRAIDGRRVAEGVKNGSPATPVIMLTG